MAENGWKWLEIAGNCWKCWKWVEMAGNCFKWLEMTGKAANGWKGWKWLNMARHDWNSWNGWNGLDMTDNGSKRLRMAQNV